MQRIVDLDVSGQSLRAQLRWRFALMRIDLALQLLELPAGFLSFCTGISARAWVGGGGGRVDEPKNRTIWYFLAMACSFLLRLAVVSSRLKAARARSFSTRPSALMLLLGFERRRSTSRIRFFNVVTDLVRALYSVFWRLGGGAIFQEGGVEDRGLVVVVAGWWWWKSGGSSNSILVG